MNTLKVMPIHRDDWGRQLYQSQSGRKYVDIEDVEYTGTPDFTGTSHFTGELHTLVGPDEEPGFPVNATIEIVDNLKLTQDDSENTTAT